MRPYFPGSLIISWTLLAGLASPLPGQGTRADYDRANNLRKLTENKVTKARVTPHWCAGNTRFWYRNDLAGAQQEFIVVDATRGTRAPAFDHARLAAALAKAIGKDVDGKRLPIERPEFLEQPPSVLFDCEGKTWRCDLQSYEVRQDKRPEGSSSSSLPVQQRPHPSRRTGKETAVTFVNRTAGEVDLIWIDSDGQRKPYGKVRPGEQFRQHTYTGHVWLVVDRQGRRLAVFEAEDDPSMAVIDKTLPGPEKPPRRDRERRTPSGPKSPDGKWEAMFKDHNLWLRDTQKGEEFPLTTDGTAEHSYGGEVFWAPDSVHFAVLRTKKGDERKVYYVESSPKDQLQPKLHSYDYLKPGDRVPQSKPCLFDAAARKQVPVSDALFPNPWSIGDLRWNAADCRSAPQNGKADWKSAPRFTFLYNERGHQVLRLIAVEATTGQTKAIIDERNPTFIDYAGKHFIRYLDETREVLWMSERDGWNHLYLYDADSGQVKNQVTRGEWVLRGVDRVDAEQRQVWFRAGGIRPGQDPYYVHYCRVKFDGTGLVVLTEGDGTHHVESSPDGRFLLDTWSRVDLPPVTELRRSEDGKLVCSLEKADWSELLATGWQVPERFVAKGRDGATDIYGVIFRPSHFDPKRQYPVIEEIYAGPQGAFVPKAFQAFHGPQAMAELGLILVKIDGMGTSNRSKKFHDVCWKNLGDAGFPDRILWLKAAAAKYSYMDLKRMGIYGGSAGGQNALRALLAHGDFYKVAVTDCGCHDNRMDKIWWNELWMGWPIGPHYAEQSNVNQAHRLQGKLLLIVGEKDENVDPASTMQVVNALIQADKDFELLVMTGRGHGSAEGPYGSRRRQDFFVRHLLGVEPRQK